MRNHRSLLALVLTLVLVLSSGAAMAEGAYPTEWDLTEIYADVDAWTADYNKVMEMLPQYESYRGTLNTAQGLYDYFQFSYLGELTRLQQRLKLYAHLGYNLNPADPVFTTLIAKLNTMASLEAVDQVRQALSVLGEDYIAHYNQLISSGHLDVFPSDTKTSGAFSMQIGQEFLPYMLFNYVGYGSDVSTLAHEMGHAIYSCYSSENQIPFYASPTIFTQEVASTTNELLYYTYKMENAATEDERLYYLENMLRMFSGTFFIQVLYAEFEDAVYQTVEAGNSLDAEELSDLWSELYQTYRGDTIKTYPDSRYQWTMIPHFYYNYYVYQYATAVSYAASICQRISSGEEGAVDDYLAFLKLGGSQSPDELLSVAKVDPLDSQTYQLALDFFGNLVDEYEQICNERCA